jgi:hypothetical protein
MEGPVPLPLFCVTYTAPAFQYLDGVGRNVQIIVQNGANNFG